MRGSDMTKKTSPFPWWSSPVTPEEWETHGDKYRRYFEQLAARIEAGEALNEDWERRNAAGAIREFANSIGLKRSQGRPVEFNHQSEAFIYAAYRVRGMAHGQALAAISDRVGKSETAIEKAIKKYRNEAFANFGITDPGNK